MNSILITDCGSTTTKAILIQKEGEHYRLKVRGEAPTTVESPFDDVTIGVVNAVTEVQELAKRQILSEGKILRPCRDGVGVDLYLSTSSAGGGLQMMVAGVVQKMTAESAQRAALGAGAIVMDTVAIDDGRKSHERVRRIRELKPDIVLLAGGTDGGATTHVIELVELLLAADPHPRFGSGFSLPVIYAGNTTTRPEVERLLGVHTALKIVENIRPTLERENLGPARDAIHEVFLEHVMAHAPGYDKLMSWADADVMATPHAMGLIIQRVAKQENLNVLAVDIGGATTDVFSVIRPSESAEPATRRAPGTWGAGGADPVFNRTVSANLGMSYSIGNVVLEAGLEKILRWLPHELDAGDVKNRLRNKMIRPTTIPQTMEDLFIEQAVAREALRLAFDHHKSLAVGLRGVMQQRTIGEMFAQTATGQTLIDLMTLDLIVGSGGILSHAPQRAQAALMMLDAYQPLGVTQLAVDSIFMMPHLGVLSTLHPQAATEVFERDCMVFLGTALAPVGPSKPEGEEIAKITLEGVSGGVVLHAGELKVLPLGVEERRRLTVAPAKRFDVGRGPGKTLETMVRGGVVGVILDGRGRPLKLPEEFSQRRVLIRQWYQAMGISI